MKKHYILCCLFLQIFYMSGQGSNCASMEPFCAGGSSLIFSSATGTSITHSDAADYGCLLTQPNPAWFYIKIDQAGSLEFNLTQVDIYGAPMDGDYICWGPFIDAPPICGPSQLNSATLIGCSYSAVATEIIAIPNAQVGQYYVLLITNYIGSAGQVSLTQINTGQPNSGSTSCAILCPVTLGNDLVLCAGQTAPLTAVFTPQGTYNSTLTTVQWLHDGVLMPDTTDTITINQLGTYTVIIHNPACGTDDITDDVVVAGPDDFPTSAPDALTVLAPGNGPYAFDLTKNNKAILNILDPKLYAITYFESKVNAAEGIVTLPNAAAYRGFDGQTIWVRVTDQLTGCHTLYSFKLNAIKYNSFITPNGDGVNDTWSINGLDIYKDVKIAIFDRYGKLIRELNHNSPYWDGTLNGRMLPADDYWFTATYTDKQGRETEYRSHIAMKR